MDGKNILITGGTSGIGLQSVLELQKMGAEIGIIARNEKKGNALLNKISSSKNSKEHKLFLGDLSSQKDIRQISEAVSSSYDKIDVLLNNAAGIYRKRLESKDKIELTFATNHLSYFLLTNLLLPILEKTENSRIVNVSSSAHYGRSINFDDINQIKKYSGFRAYGESKLANVMFTYHLDRILANSSVVTNALHPGFVATNFGKNNLLYRVGMILSRPIQINKKKGADTQIYLCSSDEVKAVSGKFFIKKKQVNSSRQSNVIEDQKRLWELSEEMTDL